VTIVQIFGVPPGARRAKPFVDHILTFSVVDNKIWFRNFQVGRCQFVQLKVYSYASTQIVEKDPAQPNGPPAMSLVEIGPRFVLTPIRIFEGAFGGATVFSNPGESYSDGYLMHIFSCKICSEFVTPAAVRLAARRADGLKYRARKLGEQERNERREARRREEDELAVAKVFA
jgi:ribosome biogenesis protein BRX1